MYNELMKLKTFTLLFAFLIIVIIVLANREQLGFLKSVYNFPFGDKAGHFILFGILSFLVNLTSLRSLPKHNPRLLVFAVTALLALAIGIEEWSQRFFPERTPEWFDLMFSYLGVFAGAWLAWKNNWKPS